MSDPQRPEPSLGDRARDAVNWLFARSRNEWIMFAIGFAAGAIFT
ncbi:MAG: hypothetical protein ACOC3D_12125 [Pseudomonadota bacterium]